MKILLLLTSLLAAAPSALADFGDMPPLELQAGWVVTVRDGHAFDDCLTDVQAVADVTVTSALRHIGIIVIDETTPAALAQVGSQRCVVAVEENKVVTPDGEQAPGWIISVDDPYDLDACVAKANAIPGVVVTDAFDMIKIFIIADATDAALFTLGREPCVLAVEKNMVVAPLPASGVRN